MKLSGQGMGNGSNFGGENVLWGTQGGGVKSAGSCAWTDNTRIFLIVNGELVWAATSCRDINDPRSDQTSGDTRWQSKNDGFFRQTTFLDEIDYEKLERMDKIVDALRKRCGMDSVMWAAFIKQYIDHMSGDISRQKRPVDYDKVKVE